jgi:hypothetical protein
MGFWNKVYRTWTNSPLEELQMMLDEFALDYYFDDYVQNQLPNLQQAIERRDWFAVETQANGLFGFIREYDLDLFLRVLEEVKYLNEF